MPKCPFCEKPISSDTSSCPSCGAPISTPPPLQDSLEDRIRLLLDQRQKIEAIKVYREENGSSLAEAKDAVESLQLGGSLQSRARDVPEGFEGEVLRLLGEGKKIEAIKLYREHQGGGLKEAKEAVDSLGERHGMLVRGRGCFTAVLSVVLTLFASMLVSAWATAGGEQARKDDQGILVHEVESEYQKGKTVLRVLLPDQVQEDRKYPVVYVLPVETGTETRYGDGLLEIAKHDLHNKFNVIVVAPTFSHLPWYADHPTDKELRQESYLIREVLPFLEEHYPVQKNAEGRLLLGFSKSGWGAWSLLLRHSELFGRAAAWDAPMAMEKIGKYGNAPIFGDQENFETYRISALLRENGQSLGESKRLILTGYGNFRQDHEAVHALLKKLAIPHEYRDGPKRSHDWHSGWIEEAMTLLLAQPAKS